MNLPINEEKRNSIRTRINALYETCGSVSPLIFFIQGLTKEFDSIVGNDCQIFEEKLADSEKNMEVYYNKNSVRVNADNSRLVYAVRNINESEGRYFYHVELANLFIRDQIKKTADIKHHLSKIFNGYSVVVESPIFSAEI